MENSREEVKRFMAERGWSDQPPADLAKSIVIEAAELLEHFQWENFFGEEVVKDPRIKKEIVKELADVFVYAIAMALVLNVDIREIVHDKLSAAAKKYPPSAISGSDISKKYKDIKKKHRSGK